MSWRNLLFKKDLSFRSKDVVMYNHMIKFWGFSQRNDSTCYRLTTFSLLTSSSLIFCTLRAGSSFFTVLLALGKCITAVPAAMLEWLWQNLKAGPWCLALLGSDHEWGNGLWVSLGPSSSWCSPTFLSVFLSFSFFLRLVLKCIHGYWTYLAFSRFGWKKGRVFFPFSSKKEGGEIKIWY